MKLTEVMKERKKVLGKEWKDEGDGYYSLSGALPASMISSPLTYIAIPKNHPDVDGDYNELEPDVNGGLTFGNGNVYGWDYGHYDNDYSIETHIQNALDFFKGRE